jgi:hypothetical protein
MPIAIEMLSAVRFSSQRENDYKNCFYDIYKEYILMKHFIYM